MDEDKLKIDIKNVLMNLNSKYKITVLEDLIQKNVCYKFTEYTELNELHAVVDIKILKEWDKSINTFISEDIKASFSTILKAYGYPVIRVEIR